MGAKYAYCPFGHPRPLYMEKCPTCDEAPKKGPRPEGRYGSRTEAPLRNQDVENVTASTNVTPPTNVTPRGFGTGAGRGRVHKTNAKRQAAHRERSR